MENDTPPNLFELDTDPPIGVRVKLPWGLNENSFEFVPLEPEDHDLPPVMLQLELELPLKSVDFGEVDPSELEQVLPAPAPADFGELDPMELEMERDDGSVEGPELF